MEYDTYGILYKIYQFYLSEYRIFKKIQGTIYKNNLFII